MAALTKSKHMRILRMSDMTGKLHQMDLNVTKASLVEWLVGIRIQLIFPHLTPNEREFLISGVTIGESAGFYASMELVTAHVYPTEVEEGIIPIPPEDLNEILHLIELYNTSLTLELLPK